MILPRDTTRRYFDMIMTYLGQFAHTSLYSSLFFPLLICTMKKKYKQHRDHFIAIKSWSKGRIIVLAESDST